MATVQSVPKDMLPDSWRTRLEGPKTWIAENNLETLVCLPAVLEGKRRTVLPRFSGLRGDGSPFSLDSRPTLTLNIS